MFRAAQFLGGSAVVGGLVVEFCLFDVDAGKRAVIFDQFRGVLPEPVGEGTHLRMPYIQKPIIMDIRSRPRTINSATGTKDLQMVNISLRVLSRPIEKQLPTIYTKLGKDYDERILPSLGNEVLKAVVAQYNAEELLSKRELVSAQIYSQLLKRTSDFNVILDDVSITHLTFGREFARAIENKQVAQQEAETQAYLVLKADQERKAAIIRAEGEADAAELISKAMAKAGNGLIEVRRIDTAKEVASTLAKGRNVVYLPSGKAGSNMLLGVDNKA
jgi:prohibitin 1